MFFLPIRYLHAWTVAAIFGVLGVLFSVALFIPQLTGSPVQASPGKTSRPLFSQRDLPVIRDEDMVFPEGYARDSAYGTDSLIFIH